MGLADKLEAVNRKVSEKVIRVERPKKYSPNIQEDVQGLWRPFLLIMGKLVCLLVIVPTAAMEGLYAGIKTMVKQLNEVM